MFDNVLNIEVYRYAIRVTQVSWLTFVGVLVASLVFLAPC